MEFNVKILIIFGVVVFAFIIIAIISAKHFKHSDKKTDNNFIQDYVPKMKDCGECGCNTCEKFVDKVRRKRISIYKCPYCTLQDKKDVSQYFDKTDVVEKDRVAIVKCKGGEKCEDKYEYDGLLTCSALNSVDNGNKRCPYACLGCGDCVKVCPVNAIFINSNNVAEVDPLRCTGCENCINICPHNLIQMIPSDQKVASICVTPNSSDVCSVGCSGCGLCVSNCPTGAISVNDGKIEINKNKCIGCLNCVRVCPKHTISRI